MRKLVIALAITAVVVAAGIINYAKITPETKRVDIGYDYTVVQGLAESGMEKVEINGTLWNQGEKEARMLSVTALFIDEYYGKIAEKPIEEKENLLPGEQISIHAVYLREKTIPKTEVKEKIKVEWMEDKQRKVRILPSFSTDQQSLADFRENVSRYNDRFVLELVPGKKGNYEVIYLFKENGNTSCGDEVFYDASNENPVALSFPINESSYVEYHIEIFGLDGMLLHESTLSSEAVK